MIDSETQMKIHQLGEILTQLNQTEKYCEEILAGGQNPLNSYIYDIFQSVRNLTEKVNWKIGDIKFESPKP